MKSGIGDNTISAVKQVAALPEGETYCKAELIPAFHVKPGTIRDAKRRLAQNMSPVVDRARQLSFGDYRVHTIHSFTRNYDVVVAVIVVREPENIDTSDIPEADEEWFKKARFSEPPL